MSINIPNFENIQIVDKQGYFTPSAAVLFQQLFTELQANYSNEGLKVPRQSTANIVTLNTAQSIGALLYDKETHQAKVNINGVFKVIQVA